MVQTFIKKEQASDPDFALQSELDQVKDDNTVNFVASTMNNWELWKRLGGDIGNARVFPVSVGRDANVTNSYLRCGEVSTNISPIVLPFDCKLIAIAASTNGNETWSVQLRLYPAWTTVASLSIVSNSAAYNNSYSGVTFSAGDALGVYCSGSSIDRPSVWVYFERGT